MKHVLIAAVTAGLLTAAGAASARDVERSPWTGPYVGLNAGYNTDRSLVATVGSATGNINNVANLARPPSVFLERRGYAAGGQIGYTQQIGMLAAGLEADYQITDAGGSTTYRSPVTFGAALAGVRSDVSQKMTSLGTARARFGYANDRVFIYGTGGYAYGDVKQQVRFANSPGALQFAGGKDGMRSGYAVGGGVEYAPFLKLAMLGGAAVTVKAEYLHYDLGDKSVNVPAIAGVGSGAYVTTFHTSGDLIRGGMNLRF